MRIDESRLPPGRRIGSRVGDRVLSRRQRVSGKLSEGVCVARIHYFPLPAGAKVHHPLRLLFGAQRTRGHREYLALLIFFTDRHALSVKLKHSVVLRAVNIEVQAETEEVLMIRGVHSGRDQMAEHWVSQALVFFLPLLFYVSDVHHAGQHHLDFNCSILTEDPVESIVVVIDCRVCGQNQFPRPPRLQAVPPEQTAVTLVNGYGARNLYWVSASVGNDSAVKDGVSGRVIEGYGGVAAVRRHSIIAFVLRIPGAERGIAIRGDHLRNRGAVKNRARPPGVFIRHVVEFQPPTRMNSVMQTPILPANLRALLLEAWPVWLRRLQLAQPWPRLARRGGCALSGGRRLIWTFIFKLRQRPPGQIDLYF